MSFKNLYLKKHYSSDIDRILEDFYIPSLSESNQYLRLAGYFTSESLSIASRGISKIVTNNGNIKLICSPFFTEDDIKIITKYSNLEKITEDILLRNVNSNFLGENLLQFANLLESRRLEIKIAIILKDNSILTGQEIETKGIFHQKVGILTDLNNNTISFSGSINETSAAWLNNYEEFKVFRSWIPEELDYIKSDVQKFWRYWYGEANTIKVFTLPEAVKTKILKVSSTFKSYSENKKYKDPQHTTQFFEYQKKAIKQWEINNYSGIFEMATGTGKTYTALGCYTSLINKYKELVTIISCPYNHLLVQWKNEINKLNIDSQLVICDSSNKNWKKQLYEKLADYYLYKKSNLIILITHTSLSSGNFIKIIEEFKTIDYFLLADEMHGLGANISRKGLLPSYKYRLGLSATPKRWFDTEGTDYLYKYFNDVVFKLTLKDAITMINPLTGFSYLTPFNYNIEFCGLTSEESLDYEKKTKKILNKFNLNQSDEEKKIIELLIFQRSNIIKNAKGKYTCLTKILDSILNKEGSLKHTIIYCSPLQLDFVIHLLNHKGICFNKITMSESTIPQKKYLNLSERDYILANFGEGEFEILLAIKCLDEGIDIPQAKNAVLLASSGNPREIIQRVGRVIRRYKDKEHSNIYDILVKPDIDNLPETLNHFETKIFEKEVFRIKEMAKIALNNYDCIERINRI